MCVGLYFYQEISAIFHNILTEYYRLKNVSSVFQTLDQRWIYSQREDTLSGLNNTKHRQTHTQSKSNKKLLLANSFMHLSYYRQNDPFGWTELNARPTLWSDYKKIDLCAHFVCVCVVFSLKCDWQQIYQNAEVITAKFFPQLPANHISLCAWYG